MTRQPPESVIASVSASRIFRFSAIASAVLFPLMVSSALAGETIVYDGSNPSMLKKAPVYSGNNSLFPESSLSGNSVTVSADVPGWVLGGVTDQRETVSDNTIRISAGTIGVNVYGGFSPGSVTGNTVTIDNATLKNGLSGGYSYGGGAANDNRVFINGGHFSGVITGGDSSSGNTATGNAVEIGNGVTVTFADNVEIYGGYIPFSGTAAGNTVKIGSGVTIGNSPTILGGYGAGDIIGNTVEIGNGTALSSSMNSGCIYGGASNIASGSSKNNTVKISSGVTISNSGDGGNIYGGSSRGTVTGNTVEIGNGATISSSFSGGHIYGGYALFSSGDVTKNTVTVDNATVKNSIYGGYSDKASMVRDNRVFIKGGNSGFIFGGYSLGGGETGNNTVIIDGVTVYDNIYGGYSGQDGDSTGNSVIVKGNSDISRSILTGGYVDRGTSSGNTLQYWSSGLSAKNISRFQNLQFIIPGTVGNGDTLLTLTDGNQTDISGSTISVAMAAGPTSLHAGNTITLLKNDAGINKTGVTQTTMTGVQGISLDYEFKVNLDDPDNTNLTATLLGAQVNNASSIFSTGRLATVGFLNQGNDFALGEGINRAMDVSREQGVGLFGAVGGSDMRYDLGNATRSKASGSHFLIGVAGKLDSAKESDLIGSAYVEAGWGDISGHNAVTTASGDSHYYGLGLIAKYRQNEGTYQGAYAQINARIGKASTAYNSQLVSAEGNRGSFDKESTYYGAGVGAGYLKKLTSSYSLDISAQYQWTHLNGFNADIAKDPYRFDDIDSHRTRVGARLNYTDSSQFTPYVGVAWEHEFSGKADGTTYNLSLEELSLKGDSGIVEVGVNFKPDNASRLSFNANVSGYVGQNEGVAGKFRMNYAF